MGYLRCGLRSGLLSLLTGVLLCTPSAVHAQKALPLASDWAKRTISLSQLRQTDEFSYAISSRNVAYIVGSDTKGRFHCDPGTQIRLFNIATKTNRLVAQIPHTSGRACWHYDNLALSPSWLVVGMFKQTASSTALSVLAMNLRTGRQRVLSESPQTTAAGVSTTVIGTSLSGHTLAWSLLDQRVGKLSERITLQDLSTGRMRDVTATPWFRPSDQHAERIRGPVLSGQRLVWTCLAGGEENIMLYDGRTKRITALTHDGHSVAAYIYGDTVAWLSNSNGQPYGTVRILDLRTGRVLTMPGGPGYNIQVGDGLVSWTPAYNDNMPLYFVNRRALRYYRPTASQAAQDVYFSELRIFDREILVPVIFHFSGPHSRNALHLDMY